MPPNSAFKDGKLIFFNVLLLSFPSLPPSSGSVKELFMGYGRLLQIGERNVSKLHQRNGSQMPVRVGKELEIQMGLEAEKSRGRRCPDVPGVASPS